MINAARSMDVAVLDLFIRCIPDVSHFYVKSQRHPGHGMIRVYINIEAADFYNRYLALPLPRL